MRKVPGGRVGIHRKYYDPAKNPKPRAVDGGHARASVAKETRQLRRKREREQREGK